MPVMPATWDAWIEKSVNANLCKKMRTYLKSNRKQMGWGVTQITEHLPTCQVWGPEFKLQYITKGKKEAVRGKIKVDFLASSCNNLHIVINTYLLILNWSNGYQIWVFEWLVMIQKMRELQVVWSASLSNANFICSIK
jgi:hypothetical protein